jgi:acetyl-CoA carboxylase biotin carboxyl carrier protein
MDLRKLKTIELVESSGIELEVQEGEEGAHHPRFPPEQLAPTHAVYTAGSAVATRCAPIDAPAAGRRAGRAFRQESHGRHVLSGRFAGAASPSSRSATRCRRGHLCIIEAMKLMNEIEADKAGVVRWCSPRTASLSTIRAAARRDRLSCVPVVAHRGQESESAVRQDSDCQSRGDRAANPARVPSSASAP